MSIRAVFEKVAQVSGIRDAGLGLLGIVSGIALATIDKSKGIDVVFESTGQFVKGAAKIAASFMVGRAAKRVLLK